MKVGSRIGKREVRALATSEIVWDGAVTGSAHAAGPVRRSSMGAHIAPWVAAAFPRDRPARVRSATISRSICPGAPGMLNGNRPDGVLVPMPSVSDGGAMPWRFGSPAMSIGWRGDLASRSSRQHIVFASLFQCLRQFLTICPRSRTGLAKIRSHPAGWRASRCAA